jgi:hypothetical protein
MHTVAELRLGGDGGSGTIGAARAVGKHRVGQRDRPQDGDDDLGRDMVLLFGDEHIRK